MFLGEQRGEKRMRKIDPRSVMIGFLLAVIGMLSIGATDKMGHFDILEANNIIIKSGGIIGFEQVDGKLTTLNIDGLFLRDKNSSQSLVVERSKEGWPRLGLVDSDMITHITPGGIDVRTRDQDKPRTTSGLFEIKDNFPTKKDKTIIAPGLILIENKRGNTVASLGFTRSGHGALELNDGDGNTGWSKTGKR
jgi:hypothetical protein